MSELDRDLDATESLVTNHVPFDVALLAKKCGFNYKTQDIFDKESGLIEDTWDEAYLSDHWERDYLSMEDFVPAPSQDLLKLWFKDVHNFDVWANPFIVMQKTKDDIPVHGNLDGTYSYFVFRDGVWLTDGTNFGTEQEALDEAFRQAFKFIQ